MKAVGTRALAKAAVIVLPIIAGSIWAARNGWDVDGLQAMLQHNPAAPFLFLGLHLVFSLFFLPRAIMTMAAGAIFGLWWGMLWATVGCLGGAIAGFLVARYLAQAIVDPAEWPRFDAVMKRVEAGGWRSVMMLRLIPVMPHSLGNYLLGMTRLPLGAYSLGSLLGQTPMTIALVEFGAAGTQLATGRPNWLQPTLLGLAILALTTFLPRLLAKRA